MKLDKKDMSAAIVPGECVESLCSSCIFLGSSSCPERFQYSSFDSSEYPQINKYHISGVYLLVDNCESYVNRRSKTKKIVRKPNFVWDSKSRTFVKTK